MNNIFSPLFGDGSKQKDLQQQQAIEEMKAARPKAKQSQQADPSPSHHPVHGIPAEQMAAPAIVKQNQLAGLSIDSKAIGMILVGLLVVGLIVYMLYRQKQQTKSISVLKKKMARMRLKK